MMNPVAASPVVPVNTDNAPPPPRITAPEELMRLSRMGASFPTRLSFMRILMRQLAARDAKVNRARWDIDDNGYGVAVYTLTAQDETYSLVAFSNALPDEARNDRVIANAWDTTYALYDGAPDESAIRRLAANAPRQEEGRYNASELVLSRANKSMRFFNHTVERLAAGQQPDPALLQSVGYLMRTTAVYGNGKFGIADRAAIANRPLMQAPFQAELLAVWLIRLFTFDLVEHIAQQRSPASAAPLSPAARRHLGIGNATGLGMAPFLARHPLLLHQWVDTRRRAMETAVRQPHTPDRAKRLRALLQRAERHIGQWHTQDERQLRRIETLRDEMAQLLATATPEWLRHPDACRRLLDATRDNSSECQELIAALLLEATPEVNALSSALSHDEQTALAPAMTLGELQDIISRDFAWALNINYEQPAQSRRFWYVSAEKLEPRIGDRYNEAGCNKESPLDIGRQMQALYNAIAALGEQANRQSVAAFLLAHPAHRYAARRAQTRAAYAYSEIHDNLIAEDCLPIDMLRFKLAFFGAAKFDPKSDLWTRIALFQGAPLPDTLHDADDWWLPVYDDE